jgi:hypothetical protein
MNFITLNTISRLYADLIRFMQNCKARRFRLREMFGDPSRGRNGLKVPVILSWCPTNYCCNVAINQ